MDRSGSGIGSRRLGSLPSWWCLCSCLFNLKFLIAVAVAVLSMEEIVAVDGTTAAMTRMSRAEHVGSSSSELHWYEVCTQPDVKSLPFCDVSLDIDLRVKDYVSRIPVSQQISMMGNTAKSYPELHIPPYQWWNEGLHGAKVTPCIRISDGSSDNVYCPTSFPCPSGLGNAFNTSLYRSIANVISMEALAYSEYRRNTDSTDNLQHGDGLTIWAPTINLQRDPRWGRNQEVPGEDPFLTSQYAHAFVTGLQHVQQGQEEEEDSLPHGSPSLVLKSPYKRRFQLAAGCKHFIGNSLEAWNNHTRHDFNAMIPADDLYNYYIPPFESCVRHANTLGIMCSYNAINGQPACSNKWLLKTLLRDTWNFTGYVTTDCGALDDLIHGHHTAIDDVQASAFGINASVDLNCGSTYYDPKKQSDDENKHPGGLLEALQEGVVQKSTIEESFSRLARVQFQLGLFDNQNDIYEDDIVVDDVHRYLSPLPPPPDVSKLIDTPEHRTLAYEAALQSIVVLQNREDLLPLDSTGGSIAVIGPHSLCRRELLSNYHGQRCSGDTGSLGAPLSASSARSSASVNCFEHQYHDFDECYTCITTPHDAISALNANGTTRYKLGCHVADSDLNEIDEAVELALDSDTIVLMMGLDQSQEREAHDRYNTTLPGLQRTLVRKVLDAVSNESKNIILVLIHGGSVSLGSDIIGEIPAIITASYGGQEGSRAIADVLFGNFNPVGKLSSTMYPPNYVDEIPLTDMSLYGNGRGGDNGEQRRHPGRTYQYYPDDNAEFTFGHGLSYSKWDLHWAHRSILQSSVVLSMELPEIDMSSGKSRASSSTFLDSMKSKHVSVSIEIQNMGPFPGGQSVLLFWEPKDVVVPVSTITLPNRKLIRFDSTDSPDVLNVGAKFMMSWNITLHDFVVWYNNAGDDDDADPYDVSDMTPTVYPGTYQLRALTSNQVSVIRDLVIHEKQEEFDRSGGPGKNKNSHKPSALQEDLVLNAPSSLLRTRS